MDFGFDFLNIQMNEKVMTCHDFHGFKWKNINIYQILNFFFCGLTPFLAHWNVIAPYLVPLCFDLINYEHIKFIILFSMFTIWILA